MWLPEIIIVLVIEMMMMISVFHKNTFFKKEIGHTLTCPSGAYTTHIQKLFSFGQV